MLNYSKIYDITLPLHNGMVIYPNNPPFKKEELSSGKHIISHIEMGTHTGTHIDAPRHMGIEFSGLEVFGLNQFLGRAVVIDATAYDDIIDTACIENLEIQKGDHVLFKTKNSFGDYKEFDSSFVTMSYELSTFLSEQEISLVGVDYLSIKKRGDSNNHNHEVFLNKNIIICEGLFLKNIEPGIYYSIILPLHIPGIDGSPVRAILLQ